jgi:PPOX class probable F420-dependent enzyme
MSRSRRSQVAMSPDEVETFLREPNVINLATVRADGRPHLVAMWYGFAPDGRLGVVTYRTSQKVRNLERSPFVTGLVEAGDTYQELRGVQLISDATVSDDPDLVVAIGRSVTERHDPDALTGANETEAALRRRMAKRVAVVLDVVETISWDHRKLATP